MAVLSYWNLVVILPSLGFCHYYILPYFTIYKNLQHIPGPWLAKFSNTWLAFGARRGKKFAWVHWAHEKYGRIVRIGYNHVSIAEPEGLHAVYAHGNGFLKDIYYEAFVSGVPGVFNVRDRAEHGRKRKIIAHAFSPGVVHAFEGHMSENLRRWVQQLDNIARNPTPGHGHARMDMMPWCTYLGDGGWLLEACFESHPPDSPAKRFKLTVAVVRGVRYEGAGRGPDRDRRSPSV